MTGEITDNVFQIQFCGDGLPDAGEECDDGNNDNGDGCSADCLLDPNGVPMLPYAGLIFFAALLLGTSLSMLQQRLRFRT